MITSIIFIISLFVLFCGFVELAEGSNKQRWSIVTLIACGGLLISCLIF